MGSVGVSVLKIGSWSLLVVSDCVLLRSVSGGSRFDRISGLGLLIGALMRVSLTSTYVLLKQYQNHKTCEKNIGK